MTARWFAIGAWLGALGVSLGAFGAHALKARVSAEMVATWETGARYQLIHALALIATGWACESCGCSGRHYSWPAVRACGVPGNSAH